MRKLAIFMAALLGIGLAGSIPQAEAYPIHYVTCRDHTNLDFHLGIGGAPAAGQTTRRISPTTVRIAWSTPARVGIHMSVYLSGFSGPWYSENVGYGEYYQDFYISGSHWIYLASYGNEIDINGVVWQWDSTDAGVGNHCETLEIYVP